MFRKLSILIVVLIAVCILGVTTAYAGNGNVYHDGAWYYTLDDEGSAMIEDYLGKDSVVTIPSEVNGHAVTALDSGIFRGDLLETVTDVTVPSGVTEINGAFRNCEGLVSVTIPDTVTEIQGAFNECRSLRSISIPDGVGGIGSYTFKGCLSLTSVSISDNVTSIGDYAFFDCVNLREIYLPPQVTEISDRYALGYASKLLPNGTSEIVKTDLTIKGAKGSSAEQYAEENGLKFVETDEDVILYPDAPFIDIDEIFITVNGDQITVRRNQPFHLVLYAVCTRPIGQIWGSVDMDFQKLIDSEICLSSEEDGALMAGELKDGSSNTTKVFDLSATTDDASLFEEYAYTLSSEQTVYVQPILDLKTKTKKNGERFSFDVRVAYDIDGRFLCDRNQEFTDWWFSWGVVCGDESGLPEPIDPIEPTEPAEPEPPESMRGDADGNGKVTVLDATRIQRYLALLISADEIDLIAADADLNGRVTVLDATRIQRVLAKICDMDGNPLNEEPQVPPVDPVDPGVLSTPKITKVESGNSGVVITWDAVPGAEGYRVFMKNGSSWKGLGNTAATSFTHADAPYNTACIYTVRCVAADGVTFTSDFDRDGYANTRLIAPTLKSAKLLDGCIGVSWEAVPGAGAYRIYIKGGQYDSWTWIYDCEINYIDVDAELLQLESNAKYTFTVRCVDEMLGDRYLSGYDAAGVSAKYYDTPFIYAIVNTGEGIELYWTAVEGAAQYRVFEWVDNGWKRLTDTSGVGMLITGLQYGDWYRFTIRGLDSSGAFLTPYDSYGRMMQWAPRETAFDKRYRIDSITETYENYAERLGFRVDQAVQIGLDEAEIHLMDSTSFYYNGGVTYDDSMRERGKALLDFYAARLRRNGEAPEDYCVTFLAEGDYQKDVWIYLALTPLPDEEPNAG